MAFDVHIAGAGPAGLFAACSALKGNMNVLVSEEHQNIGEPVHCSGLVSASGLEKLSSTVDFRKTILNPIYKANIHGNRGTVSLKFKKPKAFVFDRGEFDRLAAQKAESLGAKIELGKKITSIFHLRSRNVIGADGPLSSIAGIFNFPKMNHFACAWQGDFNHTLPDLSAVDVFFNQKISPGFIGWAIPTSEETAKIGIGVSLPGSVLGAKEHLLRMLNLSSKKPFHEFCAIIPLSTRKKTYVKTHKYNVCLAGDSAGQVKATSGGGIFFGASCGRLAGENFQNPQIYEKLWRKEFGTDLLMHQLLRKGINLLGPRTLDLWIGAMKAFRLDTVLEEVGEMDRYSKMISAKTLLSLARAWARRPITQSQFSACIPSEP